MLCPGRSPHCGPVRRIGCRRPRSVVAEYGAPHRADDRRSVLGAGAGDNTATRRPRLVIVIRRPASSELLGDVKTRRLGLGRPNGFFHLLPPGTPDVQVKRTESMMASQATAAGRRLAVRIRRALSVHPTPRGGSSETLPCRQNGRLPPCQLRNFASRRSSPSPLLTAGTGRGLTRRAQ